MKMEIGKKNKRGFTMLVLMVFAMNISCSQTRNSNVEIWKSKEIDSLLLLKKNVRINDFIKSNDSVFFYYYDSKKKDLDNILLKINSKSHSNLNTELSSFYYSPILLTTMAKNDIADGCIIDLTIYNYNFIFELTDIASLNSVFLQPIYGREKIEYLSVRLMEINYQQLLDIISGR